MIHSYVTHNCIHIRTTKERLLAEFLALCVFKWWYTGSAKYHITLDICKILSVHFKHK